jgi:hypothetical protein
MAGVSVPIEFLASFDKALSGISEFTQQANKKLDGIGGNLSLVSFNAALEIAHKAFDAFELVAHGIGDAVRVAADGEEAINRLGIALKASGDYSEQNVQAFQDLAEQLSKTSRFTEDQILAQVALAKQFNTTNKEAGKLISAATQLAAATGEDLSTAVTQLGATLEGAVGRVGRVIPSLQLLSREQLLAGEAIDVVAKRFKGFSEGELVTFNGSLGLAKKSFTEVLKAFGEPIVENEGLLSAFKAITAATNELQKFVVANQGAISNFVTVGVKFLIDSLGILIEVTDIVVRQFGIMLAQVERLGSSFVGLWQILQTRVAVGFDTIKNASAQYNKDLDSIAKRSEVFNKAAQSVADLSVKIEQIVPATEDLGAASEDATKGFDKLVNSTKRFDTQIIEKIKTLKEELKSIGDTKLDQIQNQYDLQVKLVENAYKFGVLKDKDRLNLENKLRLKFNNEYYDALSAKIQSIFQNPFSIINEGNKNPFGSANVSQGTQSKIAGGLGIANNILGGAGGAATLLANLGSAVGTALFGPLGQAFGPIIQQLAKGPDAVKQMVNDFAKALPDLITNLIKAIPAFIEALINAIPDIIKGIVDNLPEIIAALIASLPRIIGALIALMPRVVGALVGGAAQFVGKVLEGALQFVGKIIEGAGRFIEELVKQISGGIGSKGGLFGTGLLNFSGGGQGLAGGSIIPGILQQRTNPQGFQQNQSAISASRALVSHTIEVPVKIGNSEFARAIVDVKRLGFRLEPA